MESLNYLAQMDSLEMEKVRLGRDKGSLPQELHRLQESLDTLESALQVQEERLQKAQAQLQAKRGELEVEQESLARSNTRLSSISTNREYDAVHAEILIHTENSQRLNSEIAGLENEILRVGEALPPQREALQKLKAEQEPRMVALRENIAGIDTRIADLEKTLEPVRAKIGRDLLNLYQGLLSSRRSQLNTGKQKSLVATLGDGEVCCNVCYFGLTKQTLLILKKGERVLQCPNCGAFLVRKD